MKTENSGIVLQIFKDAVIGRKDAVNNGNSKLANKNYDKIIESIKILYSNDSMDELLKLLDDPIIEVRISAATYLLSIHESIALKVLEEANTFDANMTISEWKNGNLTFNHIYSNDNI